MNVLSSLLILSATQGIFQFHPKCKRVTLTHLCFVDDLLIFCKGNLDSILGVVSILDLFYDISGLKLNVAKIELFASGIDERRLVDIRHATGFKVGKLPMRYLGGPLVTRKLSEKDCQPLLDKISVKLNCWSHRNLSYGGRLHLIQSVLFSITNYWCRELIIPKSVIYRIEQLYMRYFWKWGDVAVHGARVM
ncbi:hypothetical protein like AT3G24255 [Hibiscus trionum]|uniref:Reverse transcriptase domain-containing protein n=1 Tax=Hibiscus trionum TaxID=183268 RepID=A0A9W7IPZ5_HIBTR|nr:hypothetical protein like AT3G24255 [Hibiscus trionum]